MRTTSGSSGGAGGSNNCDLKNSSGQVILPRACQTEDGWLSDNCYYDIAPSAAPPNPGVQGAWYLQRCYEARTFASIVDYGLGDQKTVWLNSPPAGVNAPVTSLTLALKASKEMTPRTPTIGRRPNFSAENSATVVNAHTWFWTDPTITTTTLPRVSAPNNPAIWVEVTATPTFTVDPGDGTGVIHCKGNGTEPPHGTDLRTASSPTGCDHLYRTTSINAPGQKYTATYTLTWKVTYTAWDTPTPTALPNDVITTATDTYPVTEIQVVNVPIPTP